MHDPNMASPEEPRNPPDGQQGGLIPIEAVLRHPVVVEMTEKLNAMKSLIEALPEAIGRAVAQAVRQPPAGASGPPMPVVVPTGFEFTPQQIKVGGETFSLPKPAPRAKPLPRRPQ